MIQNCLQSVSVKFEDNTLFILISRFDIRLFIDEIFKILKEEMKQAGQDFKIYVKRKLIDWKR